MGLTLTGMGLTLTGMGLCQPVCNLNGRRFGGLGKEIGASRHLLDGDLEHLAVVTNAFPDEDAAVVLEGVNAPGGVMIPKGVVDSQADRVSEEGQGLASIVWPGEEGQHGQPASRPSWPRSWRTDPLCPT
jgi:hypothetical protein